MKFAAIFLLLALAAVADARDLHFDKKHLNIHKKDITYCRKDYAHEDCPEHYVCKDLDKRVCEDVEKCDKDLFGKKKSIFGKKKDCDYVEECYDAYCVEEPKYCDPWAKYDECEKYGKHYECEKLHKEECTYKKECDYVDTKHCKDYFYEDECHFVKGKCIKYDEKKVCDQKKVCKVYHKKKICKHVKDTKHCAHFDKHGKCTKYGGTKEVCDWVNKGCKEYIYKDYNCKYVKKDCIKYDQDKICKPVQKGCKKYVQKEVCHDVKDKCWRGVCGKVEKKFYQNSG
jgi:hypothetical protein